MINDPRFMGILCEQEQKYCDHWNRKECSQNYFLKTSRQYGSNNDFDDNDLMIMMTRSGGSLVKLFGRLIYERVHEKGYFNYYYSIRVS